VEVHEEFVKKKKGGNLPDLTIRVEAWGFILKKGRMLCRGGSQLMLNWGGS